MRRIAPPPITTPVWQLRKRLFVIVQPAHLVSEIHSRHPRGLNPHAHGVADVREDCVADRIAPVDKRRAALATGVERTRVGRLIRAAIEPIAIKDAIDSSEGGVGVRFVATTY
jgi:hypothetical protein